MSLLPESWYIPVPVFSTKSDSFWMNDDFRYESEKLLLNLQEVFQNEKRCSEIDYGIISKLNSTPFFCEKEWDDYLASTTFFKTEKFFDPYSFDVGSGRNAIFKDWCWKGIGRNFAATRLDYKHTSGSMSYMDVLFEIFFDRVFFKFDPSANVPLLGGFCYQDYEQSFIIRSADTIRCGQIFSGLRTPEIHSVLNFLERKLNPLPKTEWFDFIINRLLRLAQNGIYQTSPTKDNLCVDGRIIDNGTVDWFSGDKNKNFAFFVYFSESISPEEFHSKEWKHVFSKKIEDTLPIYINIGHHFQNLKNTFEILGLPTFDWDYFVNLCEKYFNLPKFMFEFRKPDLASKRIHTSLDLFKAADQNNLKIHHYPIGSRCYIVSVGPSTRREADKILKKLFLTTFISQNKITASAMKDILFKILSLYELPR
jgi:hypothetical protein